MMHWLREWIATTRGAWTILKHIFSRYRACIVKCAVRAGVSRSRQPTIRAKRLTDMVYNRCVGTRYCSNNRAHTKCGASTSFLYSDWNTPSSCCRSVIPMSPVRSRGVMEKCTYCVQRINEGKIEVRSGRRVHDGEIQTACQERALRKRSCSGHQRSGEPGGGWKPSALNYSLLAELNTRPRTTYLAALRNPNPEIENADDEAKMRTRLSCRSEQPPVIAPGHTFATVMRTRSARSF